MAISQRTAANSDGDYKYTDVHKGKVYVKDKPRGTLPKRRSHRESAYGSFRAWAAKALLMMMLVAWIIGIFMFCFGRSGSETSTSGARRVLPVSPESLNEIPVVIPNDKNVAVQVENNTKVTNYHAGEGAYESPLLIITCKRPSYLNTTLENVLAAVSQPCGFGCPIIVSEDGHHTEIADVVFRLKKKFEEKQIPLVHIHHKRDIALKGKPYELLAHHFGWAITKVFDGSAISSIAHQTETHPLPKRVMILEEDIKVAPDFFSYMESMSSLLDHDPTLYAVSAFNDNGHLKTGDPKRLLRSDFFPGLGWMITRDLWKNELESKWPGGYWDDWLRQKPQRKDRQVIRPEVSRTYHFGFEGGASGNQFGNIIELNKLNDQPVRWELEDLSYLEHSSYESQYTKVVMSSKLLNSIDDLNHELPDSNVRIEYDGYYEFKSLAVQLGIMEDEKDLVPRTAYRGIVEVRKGSSLLFLTPKGGFEGYKHRGKSYHHDIRAAPSSTSNFDERRKFTLLLFSIISLSLLIGL
jgi:alpha-1,3-mannosyl-glycoprotein beta-1,2-N-acetylglucosaminyltransferase